MSPGPPAHGAQGGEPGLRVENQRTGGHQVPRSEGVTHPAGHGREAVCPGHSKDTNRRERTPWEDRGGREEGAEVPECIWVGEAQPFRMN